jgi:hypothetical protein
MFRRADATFGWVMRQLGLVCVVLAAMTGSGAAASSGTSQVRFPLHVSATHRYLVDSTGVPFPIFGDSPQALIGDLTPSAAAGYIANRRAAGFNTLWVNLLCTTYTGCASDGRTRDGIAPFRTEGDLSTPNPAYFARADKIVRLAQSAGILVMLDPIETGGWLDVLRHNGVAKAAAYGAFLGRHFRSFPNILWFNGNDFQSWKNADDDALVLAVARGIASTDTTHLQTVELNYDKSASLDDDRWRPLVQLDAAYTYHPTYAEVLHEYQRPDPLPVFMVEASYEFEQNSSSWSKGTPPILRRQEYWAAFSGSAGQLYGNHYTWQFIQRWKEHLDTTGSREFGYMTRLLRSLPWYRLVPDTSHQVLTDGYGSFESGGDSGSSDYVTSAATRDGKYAVSYLPDGGTVTVATSRLARGLRARWYDPTTGAYRPAGRVDRRSARKFTAPAHNHSGDDDWVLVLSPR